MIRIILRLLRWQGRIHYKVFDTDPTEPTTVTTSVDGKTVVDPTTATQPYVIRDASTGQTIAVVTPAEQSSAVNTGDRDNTAVWIVMAVDYEGFECGIQ